MEWQVIDVKTISPLSIQVTFADGTSGKVVFETSHLTGVFEVLKDPEIFRQAFIEHGAVTWPGKSIWHRMRCITLSSNRASGY